MNTSSLKFRTTALVSAFTVFVSLIVAVTFYVVNSQSYDASVIEIAGRQRLLIHKMTKGSIDLISALESESSTDELRKSLTNTTNLFEASLMALKDGGITTDTDGDEIRLPKSKGNALIHMQAAIESWTPHKKLIDTITKQDVDITSDSFFEASQKLSVENTGLLAESNKAALFLKKSSEMKTELLKKVQVIALLLTMLVSVLSWFFINRLVVRPLETTAAVMEKIAEKDLTCTLPFSGNDEIGIMGRAINKTIYNFRDIFNRIADSSNNLASSSEELSASAQQIESGTQKQSEKTSQVSTASHEISSTSKEVAEGANKTAESAKEAARIAAGSKDIVRTSIKSINYVADTTKETRDVISSLSDQCQEISTIATLIEDIAGQTNLLALNAAIEAARAGEQGRGFAVVADEVRKLAEKTAAATKDIGNMLASIQDNANNAMSSMDNEITAVEDGVKLVTDVGTKLDGIVSHIETISPMIQQMASAANEQANATGMVTNDIESVANITSETISSSRNIAQVSNEIAELASDLHVFTAMFRLSEDIDPGNILSDQKDSGTEITVS